MKCQTLALLAAGVAGFVAIGFAGERATGQPHFDMTLAAVGVGLLALASGVGVEYAASRFGANAVVLGYLLGVGTRGGLAFVGACVLVTRVFPGSHSPACLLWVLAAYLSVLVFETVRAVRAADRATLAVPERVEGPNE